MKKSIWVVAFVFIVSLGFFWPRKAKVFDCFPFFNEVEVLSIRLNELNDVVDYFVLVESIETQRGHLKPLYFEENKHLFEPYLHKIIPVAIRERHPEKKGWGREHFQRKCIARGLKWKCRSQDIILISDVDEIPRREMVAEMRKKIEEGALGVRLQQDIYYYKLNWQNPSGKTHGGEDWFGTVGTKYKSFKKHGAQFFREGRNRVDWPCLWKGGWHFSSMGGNEAIRKKIFSVIEGGDQVPSDRDLEFTFHTMQVVPVDDSFPEYVRRNYQSLIEKGFLAEGEKGTPSCI